MNKEIIEKEFDEDGRPVITLERNLMQMAVRESDAKVKVIEGGRAIGKSTVLADEMVDIVHDMPRGTSALQGNSFQQILTRTLPSTIESLASLGYYQNYHFTVGKAPKANWNVDLPFQSPGDWKNTIYWYTGHVYLLFSQDSSSRGPNTVSLMADEFCLLDPAKFQSEALATLRGEKARFKNNRRWLSEVYTSSIPRTQAGKFIYNYEEECRKDPKKYFYIRGSSYINKANLPDDWFETQRKGMTKVDFDIEIRNIRPKSITGGFYPLFDESKHTYTAFNNDYLKGIIDDENGYNAKSFKELDCRQDADLRVFDELDIAFDYGQFSCVVTAQEYDGACNFLSSLSVYTPLMTKDLVKKWCEYYRYHINRTVHYWFDATAKGSDGKTPESYRDIVCKILREDGWVVIEHDYGTPPNHNDKYVFWQTAMPNTDNYLPKFKWNKHNCKYLIESMNNSPAKEGRNGVEKIKTEENNKSIDQRYTTHQGDCMDMIAYYKYASNLDHSSIFIPTRTI